MSNSSSIYSKTVFLLDHTHWMRESSGVQVEIEAAISGNGSGRGGGGGGSNRAYFPSFIPPVTKSLWTCVAETVLEYARVVTDLFANERLLRFGISEGGNKGTVWLNNWDVFAPSGQEPMQQQQQSVAFFAEKLGNAGPPPHPPLPHAKASSSTVAAMQMAIKEGIEALATPVPSQAAFMQGQANSPLKAINKGRILCITTLTPQSVGGQGSGDDLRMFFETALDHHNRLVAPASDHLLPILECEFILISIHPLGKNKFATITPQQKHEISPILRYEAHVVDAEQIVQTLVELCVSHHDLVYTVVTGIPMKEEQNAQTSSNYDVKLWHPRMPTAAQDHQVLKWTSPLTPKTTGGLVIHHCTSAVRITPVDVNGRPTTCLTSFLMNGRSVWLETLKKGAGKTTTNLLTSHGGEMWLHVIETARNVLEDPPSISEGVGGRVTDYRIPDFADLIRMNLLTPFPKNYYDHVVRKPEVRESGNSFVRRRSSAEDLKKPIEMAKDRLLRKSSFWPMTIGGSMLFPMAVHIESILRLLPQDKITDMEKGECDKCIWSLMTVEARGEAPIPSGYHKKGQKREEQWRSVYNELESFIRANQHSENHKKVLECFLESRRADLKVDSRGDEKGVGGKQKAVDMEKALANLASFGTSTVPTSTSSSSSSNTAPNTDSPASPPPAAKGPEASSSRSESGSKSSKDNNNTPPPAKTLLALWTAKTQKKNLRVLTNTKLYSHLTKDTADEASNNNASNGGSGKGTSSNAGGKKSDISTKS